MTARHTERLASSAPLVPGTVKDGPEEALDPRSRHHAAVAQLGLRALAGANLQGLMDEAVSMLARVLAVEYAKVLELLPGGDELLLRAGSGWRPGCTGQARIAAREESQAGFTLLSKGPVVVEDLRRETRFRGPQLLIDHGVVSGMSVVIGGPEAPFGVLGVHSAGSRVFTADEVQFLQSLANLLGMAVERWRIQDDLRVSEGRLRAIVEAAPDGIVSLDEARRVADVNPAAELILRRQCAALVGTPAKELVAPIASAEDRHTALARWLDGSDHDLPARGRFFEIVAMRADGTVFPAEVSVARAGPGRYMVFVRDITERQQLERERAERVREHAARTAAEAAQQQLAAILEGIDTGFVQLDREWRYTYLNAAAERHIKRSRADVLGRVMTDLFPDAVRMPQYRALQHAMQARTPVVTEGTSSLTGQPLEIRAFPLEDGLIVSFQELGSRNEAEAARLQLAAIVESSEDAIIGKTLDGIVTSWNAAAERLYGYAAAEMVWQPIARIVPPDRLQELRELNARLQRGAPVASHETVRVRKDGQQVEVALTLSLIRDPGGRPIAAAAIAHDISGRKRADAAIRRQAALLNLAPVAILVSDMDRRITYWNTAAEHTYGRSAEEVLGRVSHEVLDTRHPIPRDAIESAVAREGMWEGELIQRCRDGEEIVVLSRWSAEVDAEGRQVGILQIDRDITERKQLELQLQEANRLKSEFLARMSHELRTPLNAIIGFADLMHRGKAGPVSREHHEYLGDIVTSGRHLLQLINDVLDLAKVEAGKMDIRPEPVDLQQLTDEVRDVLRGLAASKRLSIDVHMDEEVRRVSVDPARVKQILYNFLSNALKFTPEGGRIVVRITPEGPSLFRMDVEDTGIGIHPEHLGKLFVEFQQVDASAAKRHQGTGLGLALTRRIAEAHGGRVAARSAPGAGSTFSVVLPRTTPPSLAPS